ncbi:MAG: hypothetical protein D6677_08185 [Calditrichaeota bacterium]|nr:MAG: hypothetical protein D6677_08185 [Calditrichota bacterium]
MEFTTQNINIKLEKFLDFLYPNILTTDGRIKTLTSLYLSNLLDSEMQQLQNYEYFLKTYGDIKPNPEQTQ